MLRRAAISLAIASLGAPMAPSVALARPVLDRAARCLEKMPVCVDPAAREALSPSDARALARRIRQEGAGPMFIAVLPDAARREAGGSAVGVIRALHDRLGPPGTYAVVVGNSFRAGTTTPGLHVAPLADEAFSEHQGEGVAAVLADFVDRVGEAKSSGLVGAPSADGGSSGDGGDSGTLLLIALGVVGVGGAALLVVGRRRRRLREERELAEVKHVARDDLVGLGDDIRALDLDVEMPGADPAAKADYQRAVELYDRANSGFESARRPQDLAPVTRALEEGRWAMTSARERLAGREPPERRPPCFFDPRHGPSVRDVEWAPPGGTPRPVPACAADAQRVESGEDPAVREIDVRGNRVPYWNAPAYYGPWSGGYFGGFGGGFLGGLLAGELLGGGWGWGGQDVFVENVYGDDGEDGGDFGGDGGGDFGGGDFGGGDF